VIQVLILLAIAAGAFGAWRVSLRLHPYGPVPLVPRPAWPEPGQLRQGMGPLQPLRRQRRTAPLGSERAVTGRRATPQDHPPLTVRRSNSRLSTGRKSRTSTHH